MDEFKVFFVIGIITTSLLLLLDTWLAVLLAVGGVYAFLWALHVTDDYLHEHC